MLDGICLYCSSRSIPFCHRATVMLPTGAPAAEAIGAMAAQQTYLRTLDMSNAIKQHQRPESTEKIEFLLGAGQR